MIDKIKEANFDPVASLVVNTSPDPFCCNVCGETKEEYPAVTFHDTLSKEFKELFGQSESFVCALCFAKALGVKPVESRG